MHARRYAVANAGRTWRFRRSRVVCRNACIARVHRALVAVVRQIAIVRIRHDLSTRTCRKLAIPGGVVVQVAIGLIRESTNLRRRIAEMVDAWFVRRAHFMAITATRAIAIACAHFRRATRGASRRILMRLDPVHAGIDGAIVLVVVTGRIIHKVAGERHRVTCTSHAWLLLFAILGRRARQFACAIDTRPHIVARVAQPTSRRHILRLTILATVGRARLFVVRLLGLIDKLPILTNPPRTTAAVDSPRLAF